MKDCPSAVPTGPSRQRLCFVCNQPRHLRRDCPESKDETTQGHTRRCFLCNETGHLKRDCPQTPHRPPPLECIDEANESSTDHPATLHVTALVQEITDHTLKTPNDDASSSELLQKVEDYLEAQCVNQFQTPVSAPVKALDKRSEAETGGNKRKDVTPPGPYREKPNKLEKADTERKNGVT